MSQTTKIPHILGKLSHDVMLVGNLEGTIKEANSLALHMLGSDIVGTPFLSLISPKSGPKGDTFFNQIRELEVGNISNTWELFFNAPDASEAVLINVRAGILEPGCWMIMGACEPPQLTAIYYEVLAMNSELTNLIRQLSKEQARLTTRLNSVLQQNE